MKIVDRRIKIKFIFRITLTSPLIKLLRNQKGVYINQQIFIFLRISMLLMIKKMLCNEYSNETIKIA
jgi:hypothetical protein